MFGTNFPQLGWDACVNNVQGLVNKETLRRTILEEFVGANAIRVLKLAQHDRLVTSQCYGSMNSPTVHEYTIFL